MFWRPASPESITALRRLRDECSSRGDESLSLLLAGVELYSALGREYELLDVMRNFAREMRPAVEGTPTAAELERLYLDEPPPRPESAG